MIELVFGKLRHQHARHADRIRIGIPVRNAQLLCLLNEKAHVKRRVMRDENSSFRKFQKFWKHFV